jgi:hypothetical protein
MKATSFLKSSRGSIMIQLLVASALSIVVVLILAQITALMHRQINYAQTKMSLFEIRNNLLTTVLSEAAWKNTIQNPLNRTDLNAATCLSGTNGDVPPLVDCSPFKLPLTIVDSSNIVQLKASAPTEGLTRGGAPCNGFDLAVGNPSCPIHVSAQWETDCVSPCNMRAPPLKVSVTFQYNDPNSSVVINTKLLNFVLRR